MNCPTCQAENDAAASTCGGCGGALVPATVVVVTINVSPGTLFHGRYEIEGPLGRGGMGMVYKARDRTLDEIVAIKILRPDFAQDPKMAERFKSEIKLARRVHHRNVCAIHDFGEDRGLLYISMEFVEGVDLKHALGNEGHFTPEKAYDVAIQVAAGLQAVHDAGIIHRDLKTPNIMLDGAGVARLMDFGIAKREGAGKTLTATGNVVGTPEYMSPEQAQGRKLDSRSDLYALGIVVYEIFTGSVPFHGDTPISTILKHLNDPPPLDGPRASRLSPELRAVLRKALAKDPADRYQTAAAFAEALRQAQSPSRRQELIATEFLEAATMTPGVTKGRSLPPAWLVALPVLLVGAGALVVLRGGQPAPAAATTVAPAPAQPSPQAAAATPEPAPVTTPVPATPTPVTTVATPRPTPTPRAATPAPTSTPKPTPASTPTPEPLRETPVAAVRGGAASPQAALADGHLQLAVKPWAEVTVDGRIVGTTPLDKIALRPGPHAVTVRHPSWEPVERSVTIESGQTTRLVVDLPAQGVRKP